MFESTFGFVFPFKQRVFVCCLYVCVCVCVFWLANKIVLKTEKYLKLKQCLQRYELCHAETEQSEFNNFIKQINEVVESFIYF